MVHISLFQITILSRGLYYGFIDFFLNSILSIIAQPAASGNAVKLLANE
jgi:hypothetical protein